MINAALVLEGGGLRSLYTAGVLDVFMENNLEFACVVGVSAGALCGANYIAKHIGNSAKINILHSNDTNFFGIRQFLTKGSIFNFNYLFYKPIKDLYPYSEEMLKNTKQRFLIGATNCRTGKVVYFEKRNYSDLVLALQASSSIPMLCKPVTIDGLLCVDGAVADPIGINKAFSEGFDKLVVVSTRVKEYRVKPPSVLNKIFIKYYSKKYPELMDTIKRRHQQYDALTEEIYKLENEKKIFVVRPSKDIKVKRMERDARRLTGLYFLGRDDARGILSDMRSYLSHNKC